MCKKLVMVTVVGELGVCVVAASWVKRGSRGAGARRRVRQMLGEFCFSNVGMLALLGDSSKSDLRNTEKKTTN